MGEFSNNGHREYDLEERTAKFSEDIIEFVKTIKRDDINRNIIIQLARAATSVGANYCEANASSSKRDFRNKIYICKWKECHEFHLIFQKITHTLDKKDSTNKV